MPKGAVALFPRRSPDNLVSPAAIDAEDDDAVYADTMPPAARLLATLAAVTLGALLPMVMVVANKSAPATLGLAALLANLAAYVGGYGPVLWLRYKAMVLHRTTSIVVCFILISILSIVWSIDPALSRRGLIEAMPEALFALALAAAWPLTASPRDFRWLVVGLIGAAALIVFEHRLGMPLHALIRARGEAWDLKRSAIPPLLLLWPALAYALTRKKRALAAALLCAVVIGIVVSHSGSPGFALIAAAGFGLIARFAPRSALGAVAAGVVLLICLAPWTGTLASRYLPPGVETALAEEHAAHRIRIWLAFEERAQDRWLTGHGFDTSFKVSQAPLLDGSMPAADNPDMRDSHPHNIFLELWVELGLIGAIAGLGVGTWLFTELGAMEPRLMAPRLALLVSVVGVGLVGLSAWQPWWLATIAASLLWFNLLATRFDA